MPAELTMPKLSDSEADIVIIRWLKAPGEGFRRGEALMEVETDKATVVFEAEDDGTLEAILVSEGESAAVGQPIARLAGDGGRGPRRAAARPRARRTARRAAGERPNATPVARRTAVELGLSLHDVAGTGPGGRITSEDVQRAAESCAGPPGRRCPRGRHHCRADADAADDRPSHGAVGRGDPDLHRLCRRRCVAGRRASPRRAGGVADPHRRSTTSW